MLAEPPTNADSEGAGVLRCKEMHSRHIPSFLGTNCFLDPLQRDGPTPLAAPLERGSKLTPCDLPPLQGEDGLMSVAGFGSLLSGNRSRAALLEPLFSGSPRGVIARHVRSARRDSSVGHCFPFFSCCVAACVQGVVVLFTHFTPSSRVELGDTLSGRGVEQSGARG